MSSEASDEATISYPSIAIVIGLAYLLYRYFTSSSSNGLDPSSSQSRNGLRFTQAQVDQVANMFPQLSRRDIMWDLQRNRGSVNATVERVLGGRSLDPVCVGISVSACWSCECCLLTFVRRHHLRFNLPCLRQHRSQRLRRVYRRCCQESNRYTQI